MVWETLLINYLYILFYENNCPLALRKMVREVLIIYY